MSEPMGQGQPEYEVRIDRIVITFVRKLWLVLLICGVCVALTLGAAYCVLTPKYTSSVMFYAHNSTLPMENNRLSSDDLKAGEDLVDMYVIVLESRSFLTKVKDYIDVECSVEQLKGMISARAVDSTKIFKVDVTDPDPQKAQKVALAVEALFPDQVRTVFEGAAAKVVDPPVVAQSPSFPNYTYCAVGGFVAGFSLCLFGVVFRHRWFIVPERKKKASPEPVGK